MSEETTSDSHSNGAVWLFLRCKTLRESAGLRIQQLAQEAKVDRATIVKIEKRLGVTKPLLFRVFNVLNKRHGEKLNPDVELKNSPRKK